MKRVSFFIVILLVCSGIHSQEMKSKDNDVKFNIDDINIPDGYLFDMRMILPAPPKLTAPEFSWRDSNKDKRFEDIFFYKDNIKYGKTESYSVSNGYYGYGQSVTLNKSTIKLKNGMTLSTMGEYDDQGYKRKNPSALPWQRNNFKGAFEMKTKNGNFGIKVEVNAGRETPY